MSLLGRLRSAGDGEEKKAEGATPNNAVGGPTTKRPSASVVGLDLRKLVSLRDKLTPTILNALPPNAEELGPVALRNLVEAALNEELLKEEIPLVPEERRFLTEELISEVRGLGPLDRHLNDPMVSRIVVNGPYEVWIEKLGQTQRCEFTFMDEVHLNRIIARIAQLLEARIDQRVPMLDRILPGGGRVRAKVPPLVPTGTLAIDKGPENPFQALLQGQEKHKWRQDTLEDLRLTLQEKLMVDIEKDPEIVRDRERLTRLLEEAFEAEASSRKIALSRLERTQLQVQVMNEILGLGPLEPLLRDPEITEIMVNGPDQVYVERRGKVTPAGIRFRDNEHIMRIIERILLPLGKRVDERVPMVDARLFDGSRVNIVIPPVALNGPVVTIRKFAREPFTVQDLISFGTFTPEVAQFFQAAVQGRLNIIVSGGTGSGKTTTLNVLSSFIPNDERIVTIEDTAELQLRQEHVVRLEARPPNIEGAGEVTIRDLVRNALRMRPDRIIVGECRGGEAFDMLQAMNTGHEGGMTTIHANNPREALARLSNMVLMAEMDLPLRAVREQIAGGLDLIIHQQRMRDGTRRVTQVSEITGMEGDTILLQDIFVFHQTGQDPFGRIEGRLVPTGIRPKCYERILERGGRLSLSVFQIS